MAMSTDNVNTRLDALPEGVAMIEPGAFLRSTLGGFRKNMATLETVDVEGQSFRKALRITTESDARDLWGVQVRPPVRGSAKKGDALFLSFHMRSVYSEDESGQGAVHVVFKGPEHTGGPTRSPVLNNVFNAGAQWRRVYIPFEENVGVEAGQGALILLLGFRTQTVDIACVELTNFGPDVDADDMPRVRINYRGRKLDAPWRVVALKRIEEVRKGPLRVIVKDSDGRPVPDAKVSITLTRHEFAFGSVLAPGQVVGQKTPPPVRECYKEAFLRLFDYAVFPNELKWKHYQKLGRKTIPPTLDWLEANDVPVRGHCLIWPAWRRLPPELRPELENDPARLRQVTVDHVTEYVKRWLGRVDEWDVMNEPKSQREFMDICGDDVMVDWFKAARKAGPDVTLYINDYAILAGMDTAHQDHYFNTIEYLLENGAPIDGIGLQGHFRDPIAPYELMTRLDRFASFGKRLKITEFTFETPDEELQADFTRDLLTVAFSHPAVDGLMAWQFWPRGRHEHAVFYRPDGSLKPNGKVWEDLVRKEWSTRVQTRSDADGAVVTPAYYGQYEIKAADGAARRKQSVTHSRDGGTVEIVLRRAEANERNR